MWGTVWVLSETKLHNQLRLVDQTVQGLMSRYMVSSADCVFGTRVKRDGSVTTGGAAAYSSVILPS